MAPWSAIIPILRQIRASHKNPYIKDGSQIKSHGC